MVFSSMIFVFFFLPISLIVYFFMSDDKAEEHFFAGRLPDFLQLGRTKIFADSACHDSDLLGGRTLD